ncbi:MAG: polysaccharide deacetylase family protein [Candidatus Binataceae bacterium]
MAQSGNKTQTSTAARLGYPADARLMILNADDFGMCHDQNEGVIRGLTDGVFTSSTILVTCPWFEEAAEFARAHPDADLGVHLTLNAEWDRYKWGPILGKNAVPSLSDERGYLWKDVMQVFQHDKIDEAEAELRAQIDKALAAGIDVTHLDSHMGPLHYHIDYHEVYVRLARDYRLPIRLAARSQIHEQGMDSILAQLGEFDILGPDYLEFQGTPSAEATESYWTGLIRGLKPGITELLCHPAVAREELKSCADDYRQREADLRFFTSDQTRRLIEDEGVIMLGYRKLRAAMHGNG